MSRRASGLRGGGFPGKVPLEVMEAPQMEACDGGLGRSADRSVTGRAVPGAELGTTHFLEGLEATGGKRVFSLGRRRMSGDAVLWQTRQGGLLNF